MMGNLDLFPDLRQRALRLSWVKQKFHLQNMSAESTSAVCEEVTRPKWGCSFVVSGGTPSFLHIRLTDGLTGRSWSAKYADNTFPWIYGRTLSNLDASTLLDQLFTSKDSTDASVNMLAEFPSSVPKRPDERVVILLRVKVPFVETRNVSLFLLPEHWPKDEEEQRIENLTKQVEELKCVVQKLCDGDRKTQVTESAAVKLCREASSSAVASVQQMPAESYSKFKDSWLELTCLTSSVEPVEWKALSHWGVTYDSCKRDLSTLYELRPRGHHNECVLVKQNGTYMITAIVYMDNVKDLNARLQLRVNRVPITEVAPRQPTPTTSCSLSHLMTLEANSMLSLHISAQGYISYKDNYWSIWKID